MLSLSDMAEISCHNYRRPNLRIIMTLKISHDLVSNLVCFLSQQKNKNKKTQNGFCCNVFAQISSLKQLLSHKSEYYGLYFMLDIV